VPSRTNRERQVKVRVISATNADPPAMIGGGTFREDVDVARCIGKMVRPPGQLAT